MAFVLYVSFFQFCLFNRQWWSQKSFSSSNVWFPCKALGFWAWTWSFTPSITWFSCCAFWSSSSEEKWIQSILLQKLFFLSKRTVLFHPWPNCAKSSLSSLEAMVQGILLTNTTGWPIFTPSAIMPLTVKATIFRLRGLRDLRLQPRKSLLDLDPVLYSNNTVLHCFSYVEPTLHSSDKSHLVNCL